MNVNTFPYDESFEASQGSWFSGGQNNDWVWGAPAKTVISAAGQGTKCWIVGGLTGSSYNGAELSWVQSPCFDLSELVNPEISFKIFWESERRYDGAGFQYSTDGGNTWTTLGSTASNSNCQGTNWFNSAAVQYLGNAPAWTGNIQSTSGSCQGGGGSGAWLNARHSLAALVGETTVSFRFTFGSGTTCNNFQGFAFDAVHIGEAPPNNSDFTYTCSSNRSVSFARSALCANSTLWDFGDVASANNSSTDANPVHIFSAAGTYMVKLTTTFATGSPSVTTKSITVLDAGASITSAVKCFGASNGAVTATASGSSNPYTYSWNTSPVKTTASVTDLSAGTYIVTVSSLNSCTTTASVVLTEPTQLAVSTASSAAVCTANNGSITTTVSGGTAPYSYLWSNGATTASVANLAPANYDVKVTDANSCSFTSPAIAIQREQTVLNISIGNDTVICPGERLVLSPGAFSAYRWQDNSTGSTFTVTSTGAYSVQVTNASGCTGVAAVKVTVDCSDVFFPSGFTPNGDTRNDLFGPLGNVAALRNYSLTIYNRYGQRAFFSTNPYQKWNGKFQSGEYNSGTFVWMTTYMLNGKPFAKKGTLILLR